MPNRDAPGATGSTHVPVDRRPPTSWQSGPDQSLCANICMPCSSWGSSEQTSQPVGGPSVRADKRSCCGTHLALSFFKATAVGHRSYTRTMRCTAPVLGHIRGVAQTALFMAADTGRLTPALTTPRRLRPLETRAEEAGQAVEAEVEVEVPDRPVLVGRRLIPLSPTALTRSRRWTGTARRSKRWDRALSPMTCFSVTLGTIGERLRLNCRPPGGPGRFGLVQRAGHHSWPALHAGD